MPNNATSTDKRVQQLAQQLGRLSASIGRGNAPGGSNRRRAAQTQRTARLAQRAQLRSIPKTLVNKELMLASGTPSKLTAFAQRGQGTYDAYAKTPESAVLAAQVGPCTPVEGYARLSLPGSAGVSDKTYNLSTGSASSELGQITSNAQLVVFNPGSSDSVIAKSYHLKPSATNSSYAEVESSPVSCAAFSEMGPVVTYSYEWTAGDHYDGDPNTPAHPTGRVESIPIRGSMRIRNITENFSVGGEVRIMRFNGGLNLAYDTPDNASVNQTQMGVAEFISICDMMRESKRAHTFDAAELRTTHQVNSYPADSVRAHTFKEDTSFWESVMTPKYCTILVLIEDFKSSMSSLGVNNTYSFGFVAQRAARFRPGTILHNKQIVPKVDHTQHKNSVTREEAAPPAKPANTVGLSTSAWPAVSESALDFEAQFSPAGLMMQAAGLDPVGLRRGLSSAMRTFGSRSKRW